MEIALEKKTRENDEKKEEFFLDDHDRVGFFNYSNR